MLYGPATATMLLTSSLLSSLTPSPNERTNLSREFYFAADSPPLCGSVAARKAAADSPPSRRRPQPFLGSAGKKPTRPVASCFR